MSRTRSRFVTEKSLALTRFSPGKSAIARFAPGVGVDLWDEVRLRPARGGWAPIVAQRAAQNLGA